MKLKNKKTGEVREARIVKEHLQLYSTDLEDWIDYDDLDYLAKWWERYEEPKEYWAIDCFSPDGELISQFEKCSERIIENRKQIGNYFETKEEAENAVEKLKAWQRLRDKGLEVTEWSHGFYLDKTIVGRFRYEFPIDNKEDIEEDLDLLFGGKE